MQQSIQQRGSISRVERQRDSQLLEDWVNTTVSRKYVGVDIVVHNVYLP